MESPILLAVAVFVSIFLVYFLIRLLADLIIVAIALGSAVLSYHINQFYPEFLLVLQESGLLELLKITLPEQPDNMAILIIAGLITSVAIIITIPILPFSATYRFLLGVEPSVYAQKKFQNWIGKAVKEQLPSVLEKRVSNWIRQEIQKNQRKSDPKSDKSVLKRRKSKLQMKLLTRKLFKQIKFWKSRIPKTLSVKNIVKKYNVKKDNVKKDNQPSPQPTEQKPVAINPS